MDRRYDATVNLTQMNPLTPPHAHRTTPTTPRSERNAHSARTCSHTSALLAEAHPNPIATAAVTGSTSTSRVTVDTTPVTSRPIAR